MKTQTSITREIRTDTAHRVPLSKKCGNLHGHSYTIIVELTGDCFQEGSQTDMILDYGNIKTILMDHVDARIDHGIILGISDVKFLDMAIDSENNISWNDISNAVLEIGFWSGQTAFGKTYIIKDTPTAEVLAEHFFKILSPYFSEWTKGKAYLRAVTVKETPATSASYRIV